MSVGGVVYVTISEGVSCKICQLRGNGLDEVLMLQGNPCLITWGSPEGLLVSSSNLLYLVSGGETKSVLRAKASNWFWHAIEACDGVFVQEYGEGSTGIYVSEDLENFKLLVSNRDIDPLSKHFHYIAFDEERKVLIATLGDGNIIRVAISTDCGSSWRPLYKGPWQFVPVLVERAKWIFGFDSGVARGGVAVYNVDEGEWAFMFLKASDYRYAQFASITRFSNYYIGCLGYPTAILASKDLLHWYPLHIDPTSTKYNPFVNAVTWKGKVVATTGKELLMFDSRDVEEAFRRKPLLAPYKAYLDRVKGALYVLKRLPWMLRL